MGSAGLRYGAVFGTELRPLRRVRGRALALGGLQSVLRPPLRAGGAVAYLPLDFLACQRGDFIIASIHRALEPCVGVGDQHSGIVRLFEVSRLDSVTFLLDITYLLTYTRSKIQETVGFHCRRVGCVPALRVLLVHSQ